MNKNIPKILLFVFLFISHPVFSQRAYTFFFKHYMVDDGLPSNRVFSIIQDSLGFLWFGTQQGFCRFDGREFKVFQHDPENSNSLAFNNGGNLFYDSEGKIWIGTWGKGADMFDPATGKFTHFRHDPDNPHSFAGERIQGIFEDSFGTMWFCTETHGLSRLDKENREKRFFINYSYVQHDSTTISSNRIRDAVEDKEGNLWFASDNGFFRLKKENRDKGIFERFYLPKETPELPSDIIYSIYVTRKGDLYLGTNYGIYVFSHPEKLNGYIKRSDFKHLKFITTLISSGYTTVTTILEDHLGKIWIGTLTGGVVILNYFENKPYLRITNNSCSENRLKDGHITKLFEDNSYNLWVATKNRGVAKLNLKKKNFQKVLTPKSDLTFAINMKNEEFFFGSNKGLGEFKIKPDGSLEINRKIFFNKRLLSYEAYKFGFFDEKNIYLINEISGVYKVNPENKRITKLNKFSSYLFSNGIQKLVIVKKSKFFKNSVWIVFEHGLISLYNYKTGKIKEFLVIAKKDFGKLTAFFEETNGNLLIGTSDGLGIWKFDKNVFNENLPIQISLLETRKNGENILNNFITTIAKDSVGHYWLGTLNGLIRLTLNNSKIAAKIFTKKKNGLANNYIKSIVCDGKNRIWVGTDYGLSEMKVFGGHFVNFNLSNGLPSNKFVNNINLMTSSGKIIMGTQLGLIVFDPNNITKNRIRPKAVISDVIVINSQKSFGTKAAYMDKFVLNYNENSLIVSIAALEYSAPEANQYVYKLFGYNEKWQKPYPNTKIFFTNLDPGVYTLKYAVSNNNNVWTKGKPIKIIIEPAFWQTLWFKGLSIVLIILLFILYRYRKNKQLKILHREIEKRLIAQEQLKESEAKFREIVEKAVDVIVKFNSDGTIIEVNPAFSEQTGFSQEEIRNFDLRKILSAEDVELFNKKLKETRKGRKVQFEVRIKTKENELKWFSLLLRPVYDKAYEIKFILAIAREITELKKVEEELIKAKERAEKANKIKTEFFSLISHEIRTPIYTITNSVEFLKEGENTEFSLKALEKASKRIYRTVDLILRMADLQLGTYQPLKVYSDIPETLKLIYLRHKHFAESKNLKFDLILEAVPHKIKADSDAIEFILDNIVDNAIKYTEEGGVKLRLYSEEGKIIVEISDTGKGITPEELNNIDMPFTQANKGYKRKYEGNGLGLTISKIYCNQNGCTMKFENNKPNGTIVKLIFEE